MITIRNLSRQYCKSEIYSRDTKKFYYFSVHNACIALSVKIFMFSYDYNLQMNSCPGGTRNKVHAHQRMRRHFRNPLTSLNIQTRKVFKKKHTCGLLFAKVGYTF